MTTIIASIIGLILISLLFFLFELLTPSFGVMTGLGLVALGGAIWLCFTMSTILGIVMIVVFIFVVPMYFVLVVRLLPRTSAGRKLFLERTGDDTAAGTPEADKNRELIGKTGTAETQLRPSGAVRVEGRRVIALAESGVIDQGRTVRIIGLSGTDIVVRAVDKSQE